MALVTVWFKDGSSRMIDPAKHAFIPDPPPAPPPPRPPRPKPRTNYREQARLIEESAKRSQRYEQNRRAWAARKTAKYRQEITVLLRRIEKRTETLTDLVHGKANDHDYIEAMFALFSQGRYRLL